ncbi:hypothetical protein PMKS-003679 [Pichia membranifaciens]|uniref:Uncharacterized protein n=1 Tax=Pichia membranifaciens TaxID=4926 RepID=A0A1Q2YL08_9ASCO|nr:hypothetical protein PMKS-003679 [Pichia membranifaciens]
MHALGKIELPDWVLSLCVAKGTESLFAATSSGSLHSLPLDATKWTDFAVSSNLNAHKGPIQKILNDPLNLTTLYSCSDDSTVKVWDIRSPLSTPQHVLANSRNLPFFSMDVGHGLISAGSQLKGTDSELVLWDTRKLDGPLRSFIDSHNDDITETRFHPTRKNILLSGATDGYVNIYDLNIVDEDDAQLQCINYASVHSAGFTTENRIYVLSHMETFSMFDLSSKEDIDPESLNANPLTGGSIQKRGDTDFGDIREAWDCEYVIDLYAPGYVACGSNSKESLKIFHFDPEKEDFDPSKAQQLVLEGGHGEEVVRDIIISNSNVFTAGEDSIVRVWNGEGLKDTVHTFFHDQDESSAEATTAEVPEEDEERMVVEYDVKRNKRRDEEKRRIHKKHKKDTKNKKHRFKPY